MTDEEFHALNALNTSDTDIPVEDLPFYKWLERQQDPPSRLVPALLTYFSGHELKGCLTTEQINTYRLVLQHFWWTRLNK